MKSNLFIIFVAAYLLTGCTGPISESHCKEPQDKQPFCSLDDRNILIKMAEKKFGKLTEADKILFAAVADGNLADYREGGDKDKPEDANSWPERRTINASRIEWLCRDRQAKELVTDKGIQVIGAKVVGTVDLGFAEVPFPLAFWGCVFNEMINIRYSKINFLNMMGSHTGSILADGAKVESSVFLRDGFRANGEVRFPGAAIGGSFDCGNGEFRAILADGMDVKGSVFLKDGFKVNGVVHFHRVAIGGNFDCEDGNFINEDGDAILADGMTVKGSVFLRNGFKANGVVRFPVATIGRNFVCEDGNFINEDGDAILADGMTVKGSVFLRNGFKANGVVRFPGAVIGGNFDCEKGEFINKGDRAISADGMDVKSNVYLRDGFKAEGRVSLVEATVGGLFFWSDVNLPEKTILDLRNAKAGVLCDDEKSWPAKGNLFLDGFVYENIEDSAPKDAKSRIEWLSRQDANQFQPGPYEQLAKVLEKIGHNEDAIKIRIEKEEKLTRLSSFGWWTRLWKGTTIGYGYRPWQALWWIGAFILIGFIVFWSGHKAGIIVQAEEKTYNKFNALMYSIDMFVPVLDLRMAKHWIPDANKSWGAVIRWYMWVHISAGWILTTLLIVGLTGLIKK